jgi:hypothetical protein
MGFGAVIDVDIFDRQIATLDIAQLTQLLLE